MWRRENDCPPPHVLRSDVAMPRYDYTDEVGNDLNDQDRVRRPRLLANEHGE